MTFLFALAWIITIISAFALGWHLGEAWYEQNEELKDI